MQHRERVAIVGMGGIFPQAPDLNRFWTNVAGGVSAVREAPRGRWLLDPADAFDPRVGTPDRVYSLRGGFIEDFQLDSEGLDLDPDVLARLDPTFHLALHAGRQAWRSAVTTDVDRRRVGVVIGNIVLPTETSSALADDVLGRTFAERLGVAVPNPNQPAANRDPIPSEPRNGYVAGLPAGLLAQALGLGGGSYTLDAACASSLYALKLASDELLSGRADAMLTGGLSRPDPLYTQMGFAQLRALSTSGRPSPFDAGGDGLVVGEGAGMFVLKRLSDALRQGDAIHGVIAAVGLSNDVDGGLLAPSTEGQLRAMRAAYARAGWAPRDVDLIECHATGTPVGDAVELTSLRTLWGPDGWSTGQCTIGSVKSNIGHALTAAGSAGLLKVLFAFQHRTLPPTANFQTPAPSLAESPSPFQVLTEARPWPARAEGRPRRAAVSGFGFGGINAHALIEEWVPEPTSKPVPAAAASPTPVPTVPVAIVGMAAHFGPFQGLRAFQERVLGGDHPGAPTEPADWWGVQDSAWFRRQRSGAPRGFGVDALTLRPERFRIPPRELEEMLPQQSMALQAAADAIADAGWDDRPRLKAGVFVGIGLDLNTTNFHVRWSMLPNARRWNRELGLNLSDVELDAWTASLRDATGPALSANRTMGALGGLVASRIAREFRVGGPSFTVSSEETSGARALEVAIGLLGQREIDEAIVGAVDLPCDPRAFLCADGLQPFSPSGTVRPLDPQADGTVPSDGAAALIVKRLDDAVRDGDRIYAVIRGVGSASGSTAADYAAAAHRAYAASGVEPATISYLEAHGSGRPDEDRVEAEALASLAPSWQGATCALGSVKGDVGHAGAAAGLASLIKTALALHQQILPPLRGASTLRPELTPQGPAPAPFFLPQGPQFWLRDRAEGPRRAAVSMQGLEGNYHHVVLEGFEPAATSADPDRVRPLGDRPQALFAIEADDEAGLLQGLDALEALAAQDPAQPIERLARAWQRQRRRPDPPRRLGLAVLAADAGAGTEAPGDSSERRGGGLPELLAEARRRLARPHDAPEPLRPRGDRVYFTRRPLGPDAGVAFVFPGVGNHFAGMGRGLSALWPEVLRRQDRETGRLRSQLAPATFWNAERPDAWFDDQRAPILGQVALGVLVSDLLRGFGIEPRATIGYSLGESSALFALRAWTERDEMLRRIESSPLFRSDLAGACDAARRAWGLAENEPADWLAGIVPHSPETVRAALAGRERVYLLIVNTPREVVVGGQRQAVLALTEALGGRFFPLPMVSTVHCEITRQVEPAYRDLHLLKTTPPPGVRFYSGAQGRGRAYELDRDTAADAIVAHAVEGIDFPAVVAQAYDDGVRVFLETGPGGSCTRMIDKVLGTRPHLAGSACLPNQDPLTVVLDLLGRLIAERVPVDLTSLYGDETETHKQNTPTAVAPARRAGRAIRVGVGHAPFDVPALPRPRPAVAAATETPQPRPTPPPAAVPTPAPAAAMSWERRRDHDSENGGGPIKAQPSLDRHEEAPEDRVSPADPTPQPPRQGRRHQVAAVPQLALDLDIDPLTRQLATSETAKALAHEAFLKVSGDIGQTMSNQLAFQMALIEALMAEPGAGAGIEAVADANVSNDAPSEPTWELEPVPVEPASWVEPPALDRNQCLEFAVGSIGAVLGPEFAAIDAHPTRVRLPDEPLMLVDRIVTIEGEPRSLGGGRCVTEHDVLPGAWYLDGGRIPTCIAVESGQADLFLSGYLGIDFITKGLAVYRLLDAVVTFHSGLPGPGDVIRYDIHIDHFFRQGETHLFRFRFEATVNGVPLMTMAEGCAGFFSEQALAAGQGVVAPRLERQTRPGGRPADWTELARLDGVESYSADQVDALRRGDLAAAFGPQFAGLNLQAPARLPGGRMTLVHRVVSLDPRGGKAGLGLIRAEADIHPDDWFMTCHFVDDRVMPGTLMFECCLHTLRIFLARMGWIGEHDEVACEPVPGVASRLKCRGQVIESTRLVTYEVSIKELGYGPEPYAIVDALMYADGKPIVEITDMSLRMTGLTRQAVEALWANQPQVNAAAEVEPPALFDCDRITAFAIGKPSDAFGAPYQVFDSERVIARLPGPPFQFLDRITAIENAEAWKLKAGGVIEARYDVPPDAWYFDAERQGRMPFSVLLEAALQPCGWLAAYLGSALTSRDDLKFRNLGGSAVQLLEVTPETGTLVTTIKITKVAQSAGMIIQNYDMAVRTSPGGRPVYQGDTYFGFFRAEALAEQIGVRDAVLYQPSVEERARGRRFDYPTERPFPTERLRMIDQVDLFVPDGGPAGLGFIQGSQDVDPSAWYFKAHFHQDPVCPGSLGLESFRQLLKVVAAERWGVGPETQFVDADAEVPHRWTYRGQVLPTAGRVVVQAVITAFDDQRRRLRADGFLTVDGRTIFQMNDFTLGLVR